MVDDFNIKRNIFGNLLKAGKEEEYMQIDSYLKKIKVNFGNL